MGINRKLSEKNFIQKEAGTSEKAGVPLFFLYKLARKKERIRHYGFAFQGKKVLIGAVCAFTALTV